MGFGNVVAQDLGTLWHKDQHSGTQGLEHPESDLGDVVAQGLGTSQDEAQGHEGTGFGLKHKFLPVFAGSHPNLFYNFPMRGNIFILGPWGTAGTGAQTSLISPFCHNSLLLYFSQGKLNHQWDRGPPVPSSPWISPCHPRNFS